MRLVTFLRKDAGRSSVPHIGAVLPDGQQILDFFTALHINENEYKSASALLDWFDSDGLLLKSAVALLEKADSDRTFFESLKDSIVGSEKVRLLAPILRPGKLICIGLNYRDHAVESNLPIPESPIVFSKFSTSVTGHNTPVVLPPFSEKTDFEAELAVVIGRRAKRVAKENAFDYVLGYTNLNDISERSFQFADGQWQRGKSCDTFAPIGPFIVTKDEVPKPHSLAVKFRLNGELMQDSNTSQLIFDIPSLISFISDTITLEPGDIIATGTPPGVGFARKPPLFLKHGDIMEVEVEGLGTLSNSVVSTSDQA